MVTGSWTVEDGRTWWELRARDRVTAYLVVLWVFSRVVVAVLPPVSLCDRTATCIPSPGAAWWWVLLWTSILLIRLWPLAAALCAFAFAFADAWWVRASGWPGMWGPVIELVYALGCAAHLLYFQRARNRQRRFALEHAATTVPARATGTYYRWRPFPVVGFAILGVILVTILGLPFVFSVSARDPEKIQNADTWPAIAGCGFVLGGLVAWRQQRRRPRSVRGGGPAIPVEGRVRGSRAVYVYARGADEAFTRFFFSNVTKAFLADADRRQRGSFTGYLYGDLRTGGFAAFTADEVDFLPASGLSDPSSVERLGRVPEAPAPEAAAAALGLKEEVAGGTLYTTEHPGAGSRDPNPGVRSPQDRPADPPEAPRDHPGMQEFELGPTVGRTVNTCFWAVFALALAVIGVFGIATGLEHWWGALLAWAAAAFFAVAAVRVHRCTIEADEHGITVVNPLASYHIDWPDLLVIAAKPIRNGWGITFYYQLRLLTTQGAVDPSLPAGRLKKAHPVHRTALRLAEMRELYAGPFPDPQGDPREAEAG